MPHLLLSNRLQLDSDICIRYVPDNLSTIPCVGGQPVTGRAIFISPFKGCTSRNKQHSEDLLQIYLVDLCQKNLHQNIVQGF